MTTAQTAVRNFQEKLRCDEIRENEKRSKIQRHGGGMTGQKIAAANHSRLACHLLLRSIGYKGFNFETSGPSLPGNYLYTVTIQV